MRGIAEQRDAPNRPARQRRAVEQSPNERLLYLRDEAAHQRMPALVSCHDVGRISRLGPGFLRPRALVDKANEIDQLAAVHWVIDKVPARPEPELIFMMQFARWHPVRWHEPAIGDA